MRKYTKYTDEEINFLINNKDIKYTRDIYNLFNERFKDRQRTYEQIRCFYKNRRIKRDCIRIAWNKGIKGIHLNPKNEFKKGKNIVIYLDKNKENKDINNRFEITPEENVIVNAHYKTFKDQPEYNKAIYLYVRLKNKMKNKQHCSS